MPSKDGKLMVYACSAILTNAEKLNRTGSYSNFCRRCIEILSTKRQRALIDANRLQCKDLAGVNHSLCSYNLNSIESTVTRAVTPVMKVMMDKKIMI